MTDCIFCKIISNDIPATIRYEDDLVLAFDDITPKAPEHKLIIPKKHIATLNNIDPEDNAMLGHMMQVAKQLAAELGISDSGYRVLMNCNADAGQVVFHIHLHLLGGRKMTWPPG